MKKTLFIVLIVLICNSTLLFSQPNDIEQDICEGSGVFEANVDIPDIGNSLFQYSFTCSKTSNENHNGILIFVGGGFIVVEKFYWYVEPENNEMTINTFERTIRVDGEEERENIDETDIYSVRHRNFFGVRTLYLNEGSYQYVED